MLRSPSDLRNIRIISCHPCRFPGFVLLARHLQTVSAYSDRRAWNILCPRIPSPQRTIILTSYESPPIGFLNRSPETFQKAHLFRLLRGERIQRVYSTEGCFPLQCGNNVLGIIKNNISDIRWELNGHFLADTARHLTASSFRPKIQNIRAH